MKNSKKPIDPRLLVIFEYAVKHQNKDIKNVARYWSRYYKGIKEQIINNTLSAFVGGKKQ